MNRATCPPQVACLPHLCTVAFLCLMQLASVRHRAEQQQTQLSSQAADLAAQLEEARKDATATRSLAQRLEQASHTVADPWLIRGLCRSRVRKSRAQTQGPQPSMPAVQPRCTAITVPCLWVPPVLASIFALIICLTTWPPYAAHPPACLCSGTERCGCGKGRTAGPAGGSSWRARPPAGAVEPSGDRGARWHPGAPFIMACRGQGGRCCDSRPNLVALATHRLFQKCLPHADFFGCPPNCAVQLQSIREAVHRDAQSASALAAELEEARREAAAAQAMVASEQERNASLQRAKEVRKRAVWCGVVWGADGWVRVGAPWG